MTSPNSEGHFFDEAQVRTQFYYGSLISSGLFMMVAFGVGMGSLIQQSTCRKIDKPSEQLALVGIAECCIAISLMCCFFVMGTLHDTVRVTDTSIIGFDQIPAMAGALFVLVAMGLFIKSATVTTHALGHSCGRQQDQKKVQSLDIAAAVFSGLTVLTLAVLVFRPWR